MQQISLGSHASTKGNILKGVHKGSILGPLLFNVFLNDIFFLLTKNYADDNKPSFIHANTDVLKKGFRRRNLINFFY